MWPQLLEHIDPRIGSEPGKGLVEIDEALAPTSRPNSAHPSIACPMFNSMGHFVFSSSAKAWQRLFKLGTSRPSLVEMSAKSGPSLNRPRTGPKSTPKRARVGPQRRPCGGVGSVGVSGAAPRAPMEGGSRGGGDWNRPDFRGEGAASCSRRRPGNDEFDEFSAMLAGRCAGSSFPLAEIAPELARALPVFTPEPATPETMGPPEPTSLEPLSRWSRRSPEDGRSPWGRRSPCRHSP